MYCAVPLPGIRKPWEKGDVDLLNKLGGAIGDQARTLAYRLYVI